MKTWLRAIAMSLTLLGTPALAQNGGATQDIQFSQTRTTTGTVIMTTNGQATVSLVATGTGSGMTFAGQGSNDGTNWTTLQGTVPSSGATATSFSANGTWLFSVAGFTTFRVNLTAISTGSETFALEASARGGGGGAGGGGGGGAVTIADGADVALGTTTDGADCTSAHTLLACLRQLDTDVKAAIPAGGNIIGKVGIDQTTPGTTNGVAIVGVNGATALAGNGATGTGSPRVTIASDNSAIAAAGQVATGAAPPSGTQYIGANASGATGGHIAGLIICDSHIFKHITSATDTLAVQGVTSQSVYICGWRSRAAGTATWFLENTASVNANCSSANTQITGLASEVANSGEVLTPGFWSGLKNTSGNGLCINSTGTGGVDVDIWYAQF